MEGAVSAREETPLRPTLARPAPQAPALFRGGVWLYVRRGARRGTCGRAAADAARARAREKRATNRAT